MKRADLINRFIYLYGYKRYLEIGVQYGETFKKVIAEEKEAVDPTYPATYEVTSDSFFAVYNGPPYDIILVDGYHDGDYVYRDIKNALSNLSDNGMVICHDCNPLNELHQVRIDHPDRKENKIGTWQGTVWRAWLKLRSELDMEMFVIDTDFGIGVIKKGNQKKINPSYCLMDFLEFRKNHQYLLNLISIEQFNKLYPDSEFNIDSNIIYDFALKYNHLKHFLKDNVGTILNIDLGESPYYEYLKKDNFKVSDIIIKKDIIPKINKTFDIISCIDVIDQFSYEKLDAFIEILSQISLKAFFGVSKFRQNKKDIIIQENENFWGKKLSKYYKDLYLCKPDDIYLFIKAIK